MLSKLALKRKKSIPVSQKIKISTYYHGTGQDRVDSIIKNGIRPQEVTMEQGVWTPIRGRVYIAKSPIQALRYAANRREWSKFEGTADKFLYVFEISGERLTDIIPDEDAILEFLLAYSYSKYYPSQVPAEGGFFRDVPITKNKELNKYVWDYYKKNFPDVLIPAKELDDEETIVEIKKSISKLDREFILKILEESPSSLSNADPIHPNKLYKIPFYLVPDSLDKRIADELLLDAFKESEVIEL